MAEIVNYPMNTYVRYVDIFQEDGTLVCRRFPITSVTDGPRMIRAMKTLGMLTEDTDWTVQGFTRGRMLNTNGVLWFIRDLLFISDPSGDYAGYTIQPCEWFNEDEDPFSLEQKSMKEIYGENVISVDFTRGNGMPLPQIQYVD